MSLLLQHGPEQQGSRRRDDIRLHHENLAALDHVKDKVEILKGSANHGSKVEYATASRRVGYHVSSGVQIHKCESAGHFCVRGFVAEQAHSVRVKAAYNRSVIVRLILTGKTKRIVTCDFGGVKGGGVHLLHGSRADGAVVSRGIHFDELRVAVTQHRECERAATRNVQVHHTSVVRADRIGSRECESHGLLHAT